MRTARRLSQALERVPRLGLARLPTPLAPMPRLSERLGGPRLWVKREDLVAPGFGGNKLRKLDHVLHAAIASRCDVLVSGGVVQSNSQRQVAAAAARLGLDCHLAVYHGRVRPPSPAYARSGNALLNQLYGATLHDVPWDGERNAAIDRLAESLRSQGRRPFTVPYGVSNAHGALGYASALAEIADQCRARDVTPRAIVHCSGSGATQAGLALAASLCLPMTDVIGIDIDAEPERVRADVARYAHGAAALLDVDVDAARIEVVAGHAGPAYGVPHAATFEALGLAAREEALVLDPVYSGKGLAGLIALVRAGRFRTDDDVVFIHTGGEPAVFAYAELLAARVPESLQGAGE